MMINKTNLSDLFPYVYKSTDAKIRHIDATGWDEIFEPTYTSAEHSRRLIVEWAIDSFSILFSLMLCCFLWNRKKLIMAYSHSISFVTFGAQILYWPFYILSTWQTIFLLLGRIPMYPSILHCTILRHFVLACFQSAGLITLPVAINRIYLLILKRQLSFGKLVFIQIGITFGELGFTLGHIAVGNVTFNDMCAKWIASPQVFTFSITINHVALLMTVIVHLAVIAVLFCIRNNDNQVETKNRLRWNESIMLLVQSSSQLLFTLPLSYRQFNVLWAGRSPTNFMSSYGYMFTFSCVFLVPLLSMLCISKFRKTMWAAIRCQGKKTSNEQLNSFEIYAVS